MNELVTTRNNHLIDPNLHIWGWEVPVYLFFGGLVAGIMIIIGYLILSGKAKEKGSLAQILPFWGITFLSVGMGALFLDLEHKLYVWRMYTTFQWWSPMSWGSWILLLVYPVMLLTGILNLPVMLGALVPALEIYSEKLKAGNYDKLLGWLSVGLGALLGLYTGVLLSAFGARPAWNSGMLWFLFLVSGLSSAAAFSHLIAKIKEEGDLLLKTDNVVLVVEIVAIFLFLVGLLSSGEAHQDAGMLFINGKFAANFWIFVVGIGIVVPLFLQIMTVMHKIRHSIIPSLLVIFGGLMLRFIIVAVGQYSHWSSSVLK